MSGDKAEEKKTTYWLPPHIPRQVKTTSYKEKAEARRNAAGNHWRWNAG